MKHTIDTNINQGQYLCRYCVYGSVFGCLKAFDVILEEAMYYVLECDEYICKE